MKCAQVMVLMPIEVPGLRNFADMDSIDKKLTQYVESILPSINIDDLSGWRLTIYIGSFCTDLIGVGKKFRRYPSDKEYEIPIAIAIPDNTQAFYGMPPPEDGRIGYYLPLSKDYYHTLEPEYEKYDSLDQYIFESSVKAINLGFTKGFTCYGKKIKFQNS